MNLKKMVIWGTGNVCSHILNQKLLTQVDFFIDNDKKKINTEMHDRKIIHPSQIVDWKSYYIIVAIDNYTSIKEQLMKLDMQEERDFIWYRDWLFPSEIEQILSDAERFFVEDWKIADVGKKLIFSDFLSFDKGVCSLINQWNKQEGNLVLFSEAVWVGEEADEKVNIPVIKLPMLLSRNQYLKGKIEETIHKKVIEKIVKRVQEKGYLQEAAENLRMGYSDMAEGYEYIVCYYAERIVRRIVECLQPSLVIVWNAFYAFHLVIRNICKELGIPIKYMEFGNIPGTIILEEIGQMGESYPARYPQKFMEISVSDEDYEKAECWIENLRIQKLNRNVQPDNDLLVTVRKKLKQGRPVIFYAGQNDNASGMQPYTENTRKFHSPVFKSSDEAAIYLAQICEKNDWNYIYKPHPMMMKYCNLAALPSNTIVVDYVNINDLIDMSDVVVTILSTVSYIALIREKPVVMLGYTQLKGKGCTYEAFRNEEVERELLLALKNCLTGDMKIKFINHVVQMGKYYSDIIVEENK